MITKLTPDQISKFWPVIKYGVEATLPPITGKHVDRMNRILSAMLRGDIDVWVSYTKPDNKFEGIAVTQVLYDDASNTKNLLLYCVYGYVPVAKESWGEGKDLIFKYAKEIGCSGVVAYTQSQYIVDLAKFFGADTSFTFIHFDLNETV